MRRILLSILVIGIILLGACGTPTAAPVPAPAPELANTLEDLEIIIVKDMTLAQLYAAITPELKNSSIIYPAQNIIRQSDGKWQFTAKEGGSPGDLDAQFQVLVFYPPNPITEPYYMIFFNNRTIIHGAWFEEEAATSIQKLLWTTEATDPSPAPVQPAPAPIPVPTPTLPSEPTPETGANREGMIEIFKANASAKWGDDYEMVKYEVDRQTEAYDWVVEQTAYPDIMERAKQKWGDDYEMVKYEYENQVEAYKALK